MVSAYRRPLLSFVALLMLLSACSSGQVAEVTPAASPTTTFTPSSTSAPTLTFTPTITPTPRLPVIPGTQIPISGTTISAENLDQLVELARWGNGVITDACYSPDGTVIAVGTTLGATLYKADTLEEMYSFETDAGVNSLAFSPNGEMLATGLNDNTVKMWSVSGGDLLQSLDEPIDAESRNDIPRTGISAIAFSPDGSQIAGGTTDGVIHVWQVQDGSFSASHRDSTGKINSVFFSPDGQFLYSASEDSKIRIVNVADGKSVQALGGIQPIIDATISADGQILASYDRRAGHQGNLILWDAQSGERLSTIDGPDMFSPTDITGIALSPDGQFLAAGWDDYSIKIWNVASGVAQNVLDDLRPKNGWYYLGDFTIAFSPDGRSLLMAGSNVVGVWELANTSLVNSATIKSEGMVDLDLSPDGETIASVEGPNINLLRVADGSILSSDELMQSNTNVDFSPDGATLLTSMFDGTARLWPLSDQGIKKSFESESSVYTGGVAFSPDGQLLAVGSRHTGEIELRQVSDGSLLQTLFLDTYAFVRSVDFSSDGNYLAVATVDRIRLFQLPDGKLLQTFSRGPSIAFSPDGTLLAGGSTDKAIMVWKVPGGKTLFTTEDGPDEVRAVAFSPDGRLLTAGYFDGTIEVFSALDGLSLKRWKGHSRTVSDLVFTPDGQQLISSSFDGTVRVWGLKP